MDSAYVIIQPKTHSHILVTQALLLLYTKVSRANTVLIKSFHLYKNNHLLRNKSVVNYNKCLSQILHGSFVKAESP